MQWDEGSGPLFNLVEKLMMLMTAAIVLCGAWLINLFDKIDFAEGVPTKSQKFFYLRQKGAYSNRETLDKIEKIVEDEMGGEGLDTAYFVGSVLYDDPSKKDKDSCHMVAGLYYPTAKVTEDIRMFLQKRGFQEMDVPDGQVDMASVFSINSWTLRWNRYLVTRARRRELSKKGVVDPPAYPLQELYFKDRVVFTFPHVADPAQPPAIIAPFANPDETKKIN